MLRSPQDLHRGPSASWRKEGRKEARGTRTGRTQEKLTSAAAMNENLIDSGDPSCVQRQSSGGGSDSARPSPRAPSPDPRSLACCLSFPKCPPTVGGRILLPSAVPSPEEPRDPPIGRPGARRAPPAAAQRVPPGQCPAPSRPPRPHLEPPAPEQARLVHGRESRRAPPPPRPPAAGHAPRAPLAAAVS